MPQRITRYSTQLSSPSAVKGIQVASAVQSVSPSISMHVAALASASPSALGSLRAMPGGEGSCLAAARLKAFQGLKQLPFEFPSIFHAFSEAAGTCTTKAGLS